MAKVTLTLKAAWWTKYALWVAYPIHLISPSAADKYCTWIIHRAVTPHVS